MFDGPEPRIVTMAFMDGTGHTSLGWDESDAEWIIPMIRRKLAQGYTFWIIDVDNNQRLKLERIEDLGDRRLLVMESPEAKELLEQGKIGLVVNEPEQVAHQRRSRDPAEIARNHTVAHRGLQGG